MRWLRTAGWLAAVVYATIPLYWMLVHPRAQRWGRHSESPLKKLGSIWILLWLVAGTATARWRGITLYRSARAWLAAAPFFAAGALMWLLGGHRFSLDQLLGRSELQPDAHEQRLVTTGIRQYVRHPIYLGHLLELVGWAIGTGLLVVYVLLAFAMVTGMRMIRLEDDELEQRFGERHREYRAMVPAILPRLGPTSRT